MKKKLLTKTYLRDVQKHNLKLFVEDDKFVVVKEIVETNPKFVAMDGVCLIDNGYFIVEVVPKNENYAMRVFLNENKQPIEYYFDVSLENGLDKETKIPYFHDLYVDVIVYKDKIRVVDENELEEAFQNEDITKQQHDLALKIRDVLVKELEQGTNKLKNLSLDKYLK